MRRLVLLGLLGWTASGCGVEEPPPTTTQEAPLCPGRDVSLKAVRETPSTQASVSSALSSPQAQPMLVRFRSQAGLRSAAALRVREDRVRSVGARVRYNWPSLDAMAVSLTPEARERLSRDPDVLSVTPDHRVQALALPPPQRLESGGIPAEYTQALRLTQANEVWDPDNHGVLLEGAPTGAGIKVCVIDSGIDPAHPELRAVYAGGADGRDFVDKDDVPEDRDEEGQWGGGHGTHVAGIIAAQLGVHGRVNPNNPALSAHGMVGIAPGVRLLVARVLDTDGGGNVSDVIAAVDWCVERQANIISLSLGSSNRSDLEEESFKRAWAAGALSFAASGNGGEKATPESLVYPSAYDSVIAVGAVNDKSEHPSFSQGGPHLDLVAPGVNIYSTYPQGQAPYAHLVADGAFLASSALDLVPFASYEGTLVDCGLGKGLRSCAEATCDGFVAYVQRGGDITFADKVRNVYTQGARAVIIGNNDPEDDDSLLFTLGAPADWPPVTAIPTQLVSTVRGQMGKTVQLGIEGSDYAFNSGTSMATPYASGAAALVWSARPELSNQQVRDLLLNTARFLPSTANPAQTSGRNDVFGHGLVQVRDAVAQALKDSPPL
ncbi:MAG: S8 family serine peptidase [Cystobacter sp.]